jgi:hypothetical protein
MDVEVLVDALCGDEELSDDQLVEMMPVVSGERLRHPSSLPRTQPCRGQLAAVAWCACSTSPWPRSPCPAASPP